MRALVVGGTSGLGLEMAKLLLERGDVIVTGRKNPEIAGLTFHRWDMAITTDGLLEQVVQMGRLFIGGPPIDLLIWAAGFYQKGTLGELSTEDILRMNNLGLLAPAIFLKNIIQKQTLLPGFIAITSTSQWTPRKEEPLYTAVKAGLGMLANSLSFDPALGKVLVAAPAGMKTKFWGNALRETNDMLDPRWVAEVILGNYECDDYGYRF